MKPGPTAPPHNWWSWVRDTSRAPDLVFTSGVTSYRWCVMWCVTDEPYLRLEAKLSSKLTCHNLSIEVNEGDDVVLGVLIEAYPPLTSHWWKTPTSHNASLLEQRFYNYNDRCEKSQGWKNEIMNNHHHDNNPIWFCRYEALLFLKRLNFQEMGRYTLYVQNTMRNDSITFDIKMYSKCSSVIYFLFITTENTHIQIYDFKMWWHEWTPFFNLWTEKPVATVRWENLTTLACRSFGYPAPRIFWYQCTGVTVSYVFTFLSYKLHFNL